MNIFHHVEKPAIIAEGEMRGKAQRIARLAP